MISSYIDIVGKWAFVFAYQIEESDLGEVGDWLEALGARDRDIRRAQRVLMRENTGLTYSNPRLRMSLMCVGNATSLAQWWDTLSHETDHLQHSIIKYYEVESGSEEAAYLQGYIMRKIINTLQR